MMSTRFVVLAGLASALLASGEQAARTGGANRVQYVVNVDGDFNYPKGYCGGATGTECDLRGAWNKAMSEGDGNTPEVRFVISEAQIIYPLMGVKGGRVYLNGYHSTDGSMTTISLNTTLGEHHSEAIRWMDFDSTAFLELSALTIKGFHLSEPGGPPVQEFGGAINLGTTPVQRGYPPADACTKFTTPPLSKPNIAFGNVNFVGNKFLPSHPLIHYAYGVAAAISCPGCYLNMFHVNFTNNVAAFDSTAYGILWTNVAKVREVNVKFVGNSGVTGKQDYHCPGTSDII